MTFVPVSFAVAPTEKAEHVQQLLQDTDAFLESESLPSIANLFTHGQAQLHMDGGPALLKGARDHLGEDKNFRRSLEHVKRNMAKLKAHRSSLENHYKCFPLQRAPISNHTCHTRTCHRNPVPMNPKP